MPVQDLVQQRANQAAPTQVYPQKKLGGNSPPPRKGKRATKGKATLKRADKANEEPAKKRPTKGRRGKKGTPGGAVSAD